MLVLGPAGRGASKINKFEYFRSPVRANFESALNINTRVRTKLIYTNRPTSVSGEIFLFQNSFRVQFARYIAEALAVDEFLPYQFFFK